MMNNVMCEVIRPAHKRKWCLSSAKSLSCILLHIPVFELFVQFIKVYTTTLLVKMKALYYFLFLIESTGKYFVSNFYTYKNAY